MKVSRERMAENRARLLDAASRLFRERGFEAVTVAEVMKTAGLTHGAFYGHFGSKDDLIAQTLSHSLEASLRGEFDFGEFLATYLSPKHRDNPSRGCPTASLVAETRHQAPAARAAIADGLKRQVERISSDLRSGDKNERRRAAIGSWAAMVGAVIIARSIDDPDLSNEVLEQTRAWIDIRLLDTQAR